MKKVVGLLIAAGWIALVSPATANLGSDDSGSSSDSNWLEGKKAVESQDWKRGVELLSKAVQTDPGNADAHNFLGYAYRKSGNFEASFNHYREALKLNPRHKHAHEYIGEAYLLIDDLAGAERHLAELQIICTPIPCEEYRELKRAVDEYKKSKK